MFRAGISLIIAITLIAAGPIRSQSPPPFGYGENTKANSAKQNATTNQHGTSNPAAGKQSAVKAHQESAASGPKEPYQWLNGWGLSDKIAVIASFVAFLQFMALVGTILVMARSEKRQLRAYLGISKGQVALESFEGKPRFKATLTIENAGQTPAYKIKASGGMKAGYKFDPSWEADKGEFPQNTFLLPGGESSFRLFQTDFDMPPEAETEEETLFLPFVFGRIDYIDAFDIPRWVTFRFNASGNLWTESANLLPCEEGNDAN